MKSFVTFYVIVPNFACYENIWVLNFMYLHKYLTFLVEKKASKVSLLIIRYLKENLCLLEKRTPPVTIFSLLLKMRGIPPMECPRKLRNSCYKTFLFRLFLTGNPSPPTHTKTDSTTLTKLANAIKVSS